MTPSDLQKSVQQIRDAIARDDISDAINQLIQLTNQLKREEEHEEAITISANFNRLEKEIRQFLLDGNQISLRRNRLMDQMLDLLDDIEEPAPTPRPDRKDSQNSDGEKGTGDGGSNKTWLYALLAILGLALIGFLGYKAAQDDKTATNDALCLTYLQDAREAFDREDFNEALKHYTNAKNHCVDAKEAAQRIEECQQQLQTAKNTAGNKPSSSNKPTTQNNNSAKQTPETYDTPTPTQSKKTTSNSVDPESQRSESEGTASVQPPSIETLVLNNKLTGFRQNLGRMDIQGIPRGGAKLNSTILDSKDKVPFISNHYASKNRELYPTANWYRGSQWAIYHPGLQKFKIDQSFHLLVFNRSHPNLSEHKASRDNIEEHETVLSVNYPESAILFVQPHFDGGSSSRNEHSIGIYYQNGHWRILNMDRKKMYPGPSFFIFKGSGSNAFVHRVNGTNSRSNGTLIDHPLTNGQPNKLLFVTQRWGGEGTYNPSEIGIEYSAKTKRWVIRNLNNSPIPKGAQFNVLAVNSPNQ